MTNFPIARRNGLVIREVAGEMLVYDLEAAEAHCLNQTAALVWKQCDGQKTVEKILTNLEEQLQTPVNEQVVWLALSQLSKRHLLSEQLPDAAANGLGLSRRELMRKLGQAVVISLPLITSIVAPTSVQAGSCSPDCSNPILGVCCPPGCPCLASQECCSGNCTGNSCT